MKIEMNNFQVVTYNDLDSFLFFITNLNKLIEKETDKYVFEFAGDIDEQKVALIASANSYFDLKESTKIALQFTDEINTTYGELIDFIHSFIDFSDKLVNSLDKTNITEYVVNKLLEDIRTPSDQEYIKNKFPLLNNKDIERKLK